MTSTNRSDINRFLVLAKRALLADGLWIVQRDKNRAFLRERAITRAQQEDAILALTASDYSKGPELDDRGRPGEVWIFGPVYEGCQLYIKLKLVVDGPAQHLLCLSFHDAERELKRPHVGGEDL